MVQSKQRFWQGGNLSKGFFNALVEQPMRKALRLSLYNIPNLYLRLAADSTNFAFQFANFCNRNKLLVRK